jgi:hypothetical protein
MKLFELKNFDSTIKIYEKYRMARRDSGHFCFRPAANTQYGFYKKCKFLDKFLPLLDKAVVLSIGAVVDEKFFSLMGVQYREELQRLPWLALTNTLL